MYTIKNITDEQVSTPYGLFETQEEKDFTLEDNELSNLEYMFFIGSTQFKVTNK